MLQKVIVNSLDCFHCGLPVTAGEKYCAEIDGLDQQFCCPACRSVALTIAGSGLSSFYRYRTSVDATPQIESVEDNFTAFDDTEFQRRYVVLNSDGVNEKATIELLIGGIHCAACIWLIEKFLRAFPGVQHVSVNLSLQKAEVSWNPSVQTLSAICHRIASLGYQPEPYGEDQLKLLQQKENHLALRRLGVAGIGMMQVGMFAIAMYAGSMQSMAVEYRDFMRWVSLLIATPVVFYSAQPFFAGAWRGIKAKTPGMDVPVSLAIGLAYLASVKATLLGAGEVYFDSVAMFTFLLLSGRYLELRARHRAGTVSSDLNSVLPLTVIRIDQNGQHESIPVFKLSVGEQVLVKTGQVIPVDGLVLEGQAGVDESHMTGEFELCHKSVGDLVTGGTLIATGVITVQVQSVGKDLKLQSINRLIQQAQAEKPRVAQLADSIASRFVIAVLTLAVSCFTFWFFYQNGSYSDQAFWIMLSVLVVSCPCALSLATPAALTAATNRLRKHGLLVAKQHVWEQAPKITDVIFDKTGTLTRGLLTVSDIVPVAKLPLDALDSDSCFNIANALEVYSEHPIAKAFTGENHRPGDLVANSVDLFPGQGVQGSINGDCFRIGSTRFASELYGEKDAALPNNLAEGQWLLLSSQNGPVCWFGLTDSVRSDVFELIETLKSQGLKTHILSGDGSSAAPTLARDLAMDACVHGATPEQKLDYIKQLQKQGRKVMMVGDGINDVPVLAAADVSVAMANASTLAKTHADSILLSGRISDISKLLSLAKKTGRVIRQNLLWALGYNLSAVPLAAMALVQPYVAALGMSVSSLVVVFNALRLQANGAIEER